MNLSQHAVFPRGFCPRFLHQIPDCTRGNFPHWWAVTCKIKQALSSPHVQCFVPVEEWNSDKQMFLEGERWTEMSRWSCLESTSVSILSPHSLGSFQSCAGTPWGDLPLPCQSTFLPLCFQGREASTAVGSFSVQTPGSPDTAVFPVCPHTPCHIPAFNSQRTRTRRAFYSPSVSRLSPCITADSLST